MRKTVLILLLGLVSSPGYSQQALTNVQKGNDAYRKNDYKVAADEYGKALLKDPANQPAKFNLGNTQLKQKNMADATKQYDDIINKTTDVNLRSKAYYNKGLALIRQQNIDDAIQAFKQSLSLNPADNDVRDNLQKALNEKRQQDQQKQQQNKQQPKKNQPKPPQPQKQLNKQMMEQKFNELRNQEKQLQQQLQRKPVENQPEKDW